MKKLWVMTTVMMILVGCSSSKKGEDKEIESLKSKIQIQREIIRSLETYSGISDFLSDLSKAYLNESNPVRGHLIENVSRYYDIPNTVVIADQDYDYVLLTMFQGDSFLAAMTREDYDAYIDYMKAHNPDHDLMLFWVENGVLVKYERFE